MYHSLGYTYRDRITGFRGVAVGHAEYVSGCNQTLLVPPVSSDGTYKEGHWFDDQRLERVDAERVVLDNGRTPGCDKQAPKR